jgi:uncharacterized protein YecT (DUF1311 family)
MDGSGSIGDRASPIQHVSWLLRVIGMHSRHWACLIALCVLVGRSSFADEPGCQIRKGSITTTECFEQIRNDRDVQLNETYQRILKTLKARALNEPRFLEVRRGVIEAQRTWIAFRDQDCGAQTVIATTESDKLATRTLCLMERTQQRLIELQAVEKRLPPALGPPAFEVIARDQLIQGQPLAVWLQRYWRWAHSFPAGRSPSTDDTGALCGIRQNQQVFFLTGSESPAPVLRVCTAPLGKYILLPIINVLAQIDGPQGSCETYLRAVRQVNDSATDLKLTINGKDVDISAARAETGCFDMSDAHNGLSGRAAGAGYWLVFRPLQAGVYTIHFSGRYQADGFSQSVGYGLTVE